MNVYPFIEAEKRSRRNVKRACELLKVSRAAFYARRRGRLGRAEPDDAELTEQIKAVHARVQGHLRRAAGPCRAAPRRAPACGRKRVARLMRAGRARRAGAAGGGSKTTIADPAAAARAGPDPPGLHRRRRRAQHPLVRRHHLHPAPGRAGSTWPPSSTSPPAGSSAGRLADHLRTDLVADALRIAVASPATRTRA